MKRVLILCLLLCSQVFADVHYSGSWIDVKDFGATGTGSTDDRTALFNANAQGNTLLFSPGTYKVSSALTISVPSKFAKGAMLSPDAGVTITMEVPHAGGYQIIAGTRESALGSRVEIPVLFIAGGAYPVKPIWFGCAGDGATDDQVNLQTSFDSLANGFNTWEADAGASYLITSGQSSSVYIYADNTTYNWGTTKLIGELGIADVSGTRTDYPDDITMNDGIFMPTGAASGARYTAGTNSLFILIGNRITINNPTCLVGQKARGITLQTTTGYGTSPYKNITNIQINNPKIIGVHAEAIEGILINTADANNYIENVRVSSPMISSVYRGCVVSTGDTVHTFNSVSVTDADMNDIEDVGFYCYGARNSVFSGKIDNVGWAGGIFGNCPNTMIPYLNVTSGETIAIPTGLIEYPSGVKVETGTIAGPTIFGPITIVGANNSTGMWDIGIRNTRADTVFSTVYLKNCDLGIDNHTSVPLSIDHLFMNNVTADVNSPLDADLFIAHQTDMSGGVTVTKTRYNAPITFTDSDTTPSVTKGNFFLTNTTGVTIARFDDGVAGQQITVISKGAIVFDTSPADRLIGSAVDITTASGDTSIWICEVGGTSSSVWRLIEWVDVSADNS